MPGSNQCPIPYHQGVRWWVRWVVLSHMASAGAKMSKTASSFTQLTLSLPLPPFPLCLPSHVLSPTGYLALLNMIAQGSKSTHSKRTSSNVWPLTYQASLCFYHAGQYLTGQSKSTWPSPASSPCGRWTGVGKWGELGGEAYLGCE